MPLIDDLARAVHSAGRALRSLFGGSRSRVWSHERTPELLHSKLRPGSTYSPWLSDKEFLCAYAKVKDFTLVDLYRCYELWDLAKQAGSVEGAILEVGVWRGGSGCLLAMAAPEKTVYLADTFEGVVKVGAQDTRYAGGEHADTSVEIVQDLLSSTGAANARLLKGIFPEETASEVNGPIALLHVDVDVYQSGKDVVEWALARLPAGAAIVFDDYGFSGCEGITRLVRELREALDHFSFIHNLNGHAIFIRNARP